jgi:UDP-N-acetylmuramate dehydrogenase
VQSVAGELATLRDERELPSVLAWHRGGHPALVLGAGCNTLIATPRLPRVLRIALLGRRVVADDGDRVVLEAAAGEDWPALVEWTLGQGLCGLENLSLIPGSVGAAPIQNIGAYGVELAERFDSLDAVDLDTGERRRFSRADCRFAYRDSVFKAPGGRRWLILSVRLVVSRTLDPRLDYGEIRKTLAGAVPTARAIADAVITLRRARLPDPALLGNAGSFFKNPVVDVATLTRLRQSWPDLPAWPAGDGRAKLPAAWLIERDGWKGYRERNAGVHERHALVLVNHGGATGEELLALAGRIRDSVEARFGVRLEPEPVILDAGER